MKISKTLKIGAAIQLVLALVLLIVLIAVQGTEKIVAWISTIIGLGFSLIGLIIAAVGRD